MINTYAFALNQAELNIFDCFKEYPLHTAKLRAAIDLYRSFALTNKSALAESKRLLFWVDIETTGLDFYKDKIMEIAIAITTDKFVLLDTFTRIIKIEEADVALMNKTVHSMHKNNGLMDECLRCNYSITAADIAANDFIKQYRKQESALPRICGSSPHFDLGFLNSQMKMTASNFSHRTFDTSNMKYVLEIHGEEDKKPIMIDDGNTKHRAMDDILKSIRTMARHFDQMFLSDTYPVYEQIALVSQGYEDVK